MARRKRLDPWTRDRREALEVLCMLAGRTTFITPREAPTATVQRITPADVQIALTTARDPLGRSVALVMACGNVLQWREIHRYGYARFRRLLLAQRRYRPLVVRPYTFRIRIVLHDVHQDLLNPRARRPIREAARAAGVQQHAYRELYWYMTSDLEALARSAAAEACDYLFGADWRTPAKIPRSV